MRETFSLPGLELVNLLISDFSRAIFSSCAIGPTQTLLITTLS